MPPRAGRRGNGGSGSRRRLGGHQSTGLGAGLGTWPELLGGESAGLEVTDSEGSRMGAGPSTRGLTAVMEHPLLRCRSPDRGKHTEAQRATANLRGLSTYPIRDHLSDPPSVCERRLRSGRAGCRIFVESCGTRRGTAHIGVCRSAQGERIISAPVELMSWGSRADDIRSSQREVVSCFGRADSRSESRGWWSLGWAHWDPTGARTRAASRADGGA